MKLIPILFSTEMVQSILAGRKKQTRREIKPQPYPVYRTGFLKGEPDCYECDFGKYTDIPFDEWKNFCPYGQVGDVLWVRETWAPAFSVFAYKADYTAETLALPENKGIWKPSIHMPFKAARIFLKITNIRVERLQDITWQNILDEGLQTDYSGIQGIQDLESKWKLLWQSIYGQKSWDANPWVWVIEFERVEKP